MITSEFTKILVTVSSILAAFSIASTTILLTSSSENLNSAKKKSTNRTKHTGTKISYFQLILIRNFYSIFSQMILLFLSLIFTLLINFDSILVYIFTIELFLLFHSVFILILTVTSMYHLMWNE